MNKIKRVGTCGTYDYILHPGHISMLEFCSSLGEELVVFVVSDATVENNKGRRPYYNQETRARNLLLVPSVSEVILLCGDDDVMQIANSALDLYVLGYDQHTEFDEAIIAILDDNVVRRMPSSTSGVYSTTKMLDMSMNKHA